MILKIDNECKVLDIKDVNSIFFKFSYVVKTLSIADNPLAVLAFAAPKISPQTSYKRC